MATFLGTALPSAVSTDLSEAGVNGAAALPAVLPSSSAHDAGCCCAAKIFGFAELSVSELCKSRFVGRVVDVRSACEFTGELGHVPGSELVPLSDISDEAEEWEREQPILLVCRSGARSMEAAKELARMGFRRLYNLVGGMLAYRAAGLPIARGSHQRE